MSKKIEIVNNGLIITDTVSGLIEVSQPSKDVWYIEKDLKNSSVSFYDTNGTNDLANKSVFPTLLLSDCVDSGLVAFTESTFRDFCLLNLGKSSGGSTSGTTSGFIDYNDASTATTPIVLVADTWIELPNDGLGSFTNKNFLPQGVTELMLTPSGYIDASDLDLGDAMFVRNDYTVNPNTNNSLLKFRYSLGTGGAAYTLEKTVGRLDAGSGVDYRRSLVTDLIYMGDSNTKDNIIKLEINLSTTGTLINSGSVIQVIKY